MTFLAPLFLAGLLAIALPVLIHLSHKEKKDVVPFPSLMFLEQVPFKAVKRQRLRHWFLLLLRALAIALLALAFARPFFDRDTALAGAPTGARELVLLLDRSYSMGYGDRWQRARSAAHDAAQNLAPDDRVTFVLFDTRATQGSKGTSDASVIHNAIDQATLGASGTRFGPALQLAQKVLEESNRPRLAVVVISDFQRSGWDGQDEVALPEGTEVTWVNVADDDPSNAAVADLVLNRQLNGGRELVAAVARITYQGTEARSGIPVHLEVDGQVVAEASVDLEPNGAGTVAFPPFALGQGPVRGVVRLGGDRLAADDAFYFAIERGRTVPVTVLVGPSARDRQTLFLRRALAIGQRPPLAVRIKQATEVRPSDLREGGVVILDDAPWPAGSAGRALQAYVRDGGGLIVIAGPRTQPGSWATSAGVITADVGSPVDRSADRGGSLSFLEYTHPVFDVFSAPRSGDFSSTRFYRYRPLRFDSTMTTLARFDDGNAALVEGRAGEGRVLVWATSVDDVWNDLALQPIFLPFVHQLAKYAAGYAALKSWIGLGDVLDLGGIADLFAAAGDSTDRIVVEHPSGSRSLLEITGESTFLELDQPGFYALRPLEGADRVETVAVNVNVTESDLAVLDPQVIADAVTGSGLVRPQSLVEATLSPKERERRQGLWWYLVVAALVFLAAETMISNRLAPVAR